MRGLREWAQRCRCRSGLIAAGALAPALAFWIGCGPSSDPDPTPDPRPSFLLLMSDDQAWSELGHRGHPHVATPSLDDMAVSGLRFDRFYAAAPVCSPTRASVLTGRHPNRSGVLSWRYALRPEEISIAALLSREGYRTGHFGKWHLGPVLGDSPVRPAAFGFDTSLAHDNVFDGNPSLSRDGADPRTHPGESSQVLVEAALEFVDRAVAEGRPFFATIWFASPHRPYQALESDLDRYADADPPLRARYAEITAMDRAIGRLRRALGERGVSENTLVWFCSDNGPPTGVEEKGGLTARKGYLFEGGIRVPGIVEWPATMRGPRTTSTPAVTSDIFPTILDLLDIAPPDNRPLDGVSLRPLLEGEELERAPIGFWGLPDDDPETRNRPWIDPERLMAGAPVAGWPRYRFLNFQHPRPRTRGFGGQAAWMDGRWKLLALAGPWPDTLLEPTRVFSEDGSLLYMLFDLEEDPGEQHDLAGHHPQRVRQMGEALRTWRISVDRSLSGADYRGPDDRSTTDRSARDPVDATTSAPLATSKTSAGR